MIKAQLILASKSAITGIPLYTFILTEPRIILAEVNTHRVLSRNAASSRAISIKKQRANVIDNPFIPLSIGENQKGMQAGKELQGWRRWGCIKVWEYSRFAMVLANLALEKLGAHKQVANRLVEPWMWVEQVVSATDWNNLLALRNHDAAEPHFHELARQIQECIQIAEHNFAFMEANNLKFYHDDKFSQVGTCQILGEGEWHLPFDQGEYSDEGTHLTLSERKQTSSARCARVSFYLPEGGKSKVGADLTLAQRLSGSGHWSPFEHQATPAPTAEYCGNFRGWKQFRKEFPNENGENSVLTGTKV
jgi:hypothetical protein